MTCACFCQLFDPIVEADGFLRAGMLLRAVRWLSKLVDAISHAHKCGLSHGQIRAEHLLLRNDDPTLLGFDPPAWRQLKRGPSLGDSLALRPRDHEGRDAPELAGRSHARFSELAAADVWSLGVLFVSMLLGEPPDTSPLADQATIQLPRGLYEVRMRSRTVVELATHKRAPRAWTRASRTSRALPRTPRALPRTPASCVAHKCSHPRSRSGACKCDYPRRLHARCLTRQPARHHFDSSCSASHPHAASISATVTQALAGGGGVRGGRA